ncbi:MAG TPA: S8 family peptidase [Symbiobacteriaceae bacterium]|jgi:serine protease AprX
MNRRILAVTAALLLVCSIVALPAAAGMVQPSGASVAQPAGSAAPGPVITTRPDKLMSLLADRLETAGDADTFDVIVQFADPPTAARYLLVAQAAGNVAYKAQWDKALYGFSATLTQAQIRALQALPFVKQIDLDLPVQATLDTSTLYTGARQARADYGITGSRGQPCCSKNNVVAAVIDTGIDGSHTDLAGTVIGFKDFINNRTTAYDDHGHGSHVAGIIAGRGTANAAYAGNAPGAALVGVKVLDSRGSGSFTTIINGINWVINNRATYGIKVANMSLGGTGCSNGTDALSTAVNNAVNNGIVMVVAAGNSGPGTCTISSPAAAANAITVGAAADPGLRAAKAGWTLAPFSSRGPTADGRVKPDVVAPGVAIVSVKANSGNQYVAMSGTSMATPEVAGVVALMFAANYSLTPAQVKADLRSTAVDWGAAGADNDYGAGLIKAYDTIKMPLATGTYSIKVYSYSGSGRYDLDTSRQ